MAVPFPRTWSVGDLITAAFLNAIRDAINWFNATPTCEAYASAAQSVAVSATWTVLAMDAASLNNNSMWASGANTQFTCAIAGTYLISGQVSFTSNATGRRIAGIGSNGATANLVQSEVAVSSANSTVAQIPARRVHLNVGDYIQLQGYQSSGGSLALNVGNQSTFLSAQLVSNL